MKEQTVESKGWNMPGGIITARLIPTSVGNISVLFSVKNRNTVHPLK